MDSEESPGDTEQAYPYFSSPPPEGTSERASYERLLVTADEYFAVQGPNAPLNEIARGAGVDDATVSRWFPTREHLIVAVSGRHIRETCEKGAELSDSLPPGEAATEWIRYLIAQIASRREMVAAMFTLQAQTDVPFKCNLEIAATASGLLDRAKAAGAFRSDLDARDVAKLSAAVAFATETDAADEAERFMSLVLDALQPDGS